MPKPNVSLGGIFRSTDGGSTWTKLPRIDTPLHVLVDPKDGNHLYVVDGVWGSTGGFWVSQDGGASFTQPAGFVAACKANTGGSVDTYDVSADPSDFQHIIVSFHSSGGSSVAPGVLESKDGGSSWVGHPGVKGGYGQSIHFLHNPALGLGDSNTWLLGTQGLGFWRTTDGGATWTKVSDGQITHGGNAICYSSAGAVYSGGYGYPSRSTDNGRTWSLLSSSGLPQDWYMGLLCDGKNIWTQPQSGGTFYLSPDKDGTHFAAYDGGKQTGFAAGMFWMSLDAKNRIIYSAQGAPNVHELWALKLTN